LKHRWFKTNEYSVQENKNSICFLKFNSYNNDNESEDGIMGED